MITIESISLTVKHLFSAFNKLHPPEGRILVMKIFDSSILFKVENILLINKFNTNISSNVIVRSMMNVL